MARVTIVGNGEAFDPELANTSVLYRGALTLLVDCGYAVPHALWRLSRDANLLDAIYVTHWHADHSFGLPALLLWMQEEGRTRPLEVIGGPGVARWLKRLLALGYPGAYGGFELRPAELAPGSALERSGTTLRNAQSRHSVRNLALRIDEGEKCVCVAGDGAPSDATRALYRGATLLIHECYYAGRASDQHASATELCGLADELELGTLALVHRSRREKEAIAALAAGHERVVIPNAGDTLEI